MKFVMLALLMCSPSFAGEWTRLASLPDTEGFAGGFAGVSHGVLLVAGGANFPEKKPWEGGTKVWYDHVFALEKPDGTWKLVGKLPRRLGYGVSVTSRDRVICVGGSDLLRHYADVFQLEWRDGSLVITNLIALPKPFANGSGALLGDRLYVAGGQTSPLSTEASNEVWMLDLAAQPHEWKQVAPFPGPGRILSVAAGTDNGFYQFGGAELVANEDGSSSRRYLRGAYRYHESTGWKRLADLPHPLVAAPSPSPRDVGHIYMLGGDDGTQVGVPTEKHSGFRPELLRYAIRSDTWAEMGKLPAPRVTVPCVEWGGAWVVPSGEMRPGIRSPEVWSMKLQPE